MLALGEYPEFAEAMAMAVESDVTLRRRQLFATRVRTGRLAFRAVQNTVVNDRTERETNDGNNYEEASGKEGGAHQKEWNHERL